MERLHLERLHIIRFPSRISSVSYSPKANYLAVGGKAGLIVFKANKNGRCFIPICKDMIKDQLLTLQWVEENELLVLRYTPNMTLYHERLTVPDLKDQSILEPTVSESIIRKSYTYCQHLKLFCCTEVPEIEESRHLFAVSGSGAEGCYYSPIGCRSLAIYKVPFDVPIQMNELS